MPHDITTVGGVAPTTAGKVDIKAADGDNFVRQTTASNLNAQVVGNVAEAGTDAGNPVSVAGIYQATLPTYTDGQRGRLHIDNKGGLIQTVEASGAHVDGDAAGNNINLTRDSAGNGLYYLTKPRQFNGTSWDRERNNEEATLLASAARTTTQTSADLTNFSGQGVLIVVLDMTTVGTASVTVSIDGKDSASGKYYNLLTGAAITTISTNRYRVGPSVTAVANSIAQDYLPRIFRIVVTANNANSGTYSVGYVLAGRG